MATRDRELPVNKLAGSRVKKQRRAASRLQRQTTPEVLRVELRFTLDHDDVLDANRALSMPRWGVWIVLILLVLMLFVGLYLIQQDFPVAGYLWLTLSTLVGMGTYAVPRLHVRRALRRSPSLQGEIVVVVSDEGITTIFPTGNSQLDWREYKGYRETPTLFVLLYSSGGYMLIPKRAMSLGQTEELRGLFARRMAIR